MFLDRNNTFQLTIYKKSERDIKTGILFMKVIVPLNSMLILDANWDQMLEFSYEITQDKCCIKGKYLGEQKNFCVPSVISQYCMIREKKMLIKKGRINTKCFMIFYLLLTNS